GEPRRQGAPARPSPRPRAAARATCMPAWTSIRGACYEIATARPSTRAHDPEAPVALRPVLKFPDPRLREVSRPVTEVTDALRELARDMCEVMYDEPGIGLAAPQVGESVRLIVVHTQWTAQAADRTPLLLLDPRLPH